MEFIMNKIKAMSNCRVLFGNLIDETDILCSEFESAKNNLMVCLMEEKYAMINCRLSASFDHDRAVDKKVKTKLRNKVKSLDIKIAKFDDYAVKKMTSLEKKAPTAAPRYRFEMASI